MPGAADIMREISHLSPQYIYINATYALLNTNLKKPRTQRRNDISQPNTEHMYSPSASMTAGDCGKRSFLIVAETKHKPP